MRALDPLDILQLVGTTGFVVALVPQLMRTLKVRHAKGVSVSYLIILIVSSFVLLAYSFLTDLYFFLASYVANIVVWSVVLWFRVRPSPQAA